MKKLLFMLACLVSFALSAQEAFTIFGITLGAPFNEKEFRGRIWSSRDIKNPVELSGELATPFRKFEDVRIKLTEFTRCVYCVKTETLKVPEELMEAEFNRVIITLEKKYGLSFSEHKKDMFHKSRMAKNDNVIVTVTDNLNGGSLRIEFEARNKAQLIEDDAKQNASVILQEDLDAL